MSAGGSAGPEELALRQAGGLLVLGLAGPELESEEAAALDEIRPAGVILFARNVEDAGQVDRLCRSVRARLPRALLLIDQEGGRVDRLRGILGPSAPARELASRGAQAVSRQAELTAAALRLLGLNFNCSPVVDLDEGHEGNGIGDRSFGAEPAQVAELAALVVAAHEAQGIASCLKHFPGLGRTRGDTHALRPTVSASREELLRRELEAFRRVAAPAVMVSHAVFPALGPERPACWSGAIVDGLLRTELGFRGLVLTDDLEMGAVTDRPASERGLAAVEAGCDLLLFCHRLDEAEAARRALAAARLEERLAAGRMEASLRRIADLTDRLAPPPAELDRGALAEIQAALANARGGASV